MSCVLFFISRNLVIVVPSLYQLRYRQLRAASTAARPTRTYRTARFVATADRTTSVGATSRAGGPRLFAFARSARPTTGVRRERLIGPRAPETRRRTVRGGRRWFFARKTVTLCRRGRANVTQ